MLILGIDPGKKGAIVALDLNCRIKLARVFDKLDATGLISVIRETLKELGPRVVGYKETFRGFGLDPRTGYSVGYQHALIDLAFREAGIQLKEVEPKAWVEAIHDPGTNRLKPKVRNLDLARSLFPEKILIAPRGKTPHEGIVDAALIALYGRNDSLSDAGIASIARTAHPPGNI